MPKRIKSLLQRIYVLSASFYYTCISSDMIVIYPFFSNKNRQSKERLAILHLNSINSPLFSNVCSNNVTTLIKKIRFRSKIEK